MQTLVVPAPVFLLTSWVLVNLVVFTALRLIFWRLFRQPGAPVPGSVLLRAFFVGSKFDLRLALLISLPVFLLSVLPGVNPFVNQVSRGLVIGYAVAISVAVMFLYLVDFGHFAYLETRLNRTALGYLRDLGTSLKMVRETYPVSWCLAGLLVLAVLVGAAATDEIRWLERAAAGAQTGGLRGGIIYGVTGVLAALGLYGSLTRYPLRWSNAFFQTRTLVSALASNPVLYFFDTLGKKHQPYDLDNTRRAYPLMAGYLRPDEPDADRLAFTRRLAPTGPMGNRPNVVMVSLESFAAFKTGAFGNPMDPTPHFDALCRRGTLFSNFYTPIVGTARSIFTAVTGLPDVDPHATSSRNPLIVSQHTIINDFVGHEKFYFLGGSLSWANIRGLLLHNIDGLRIFEEGSYRSPRVDVWGISDLHLFEEANQVFRRRTAPFFAMIQTSGNHRPYTIPADSRGFEWRDVPGADLQPHGFRSAKEFNSLRFMDHSIGCFIEMASQEAYFENTVFVFYGDHGVGGHARHLPKFEQELRLNRFHVPLLIYAPSVPGASVPNETLASEVDLLPTLAAFTSTPHLNSTMGRDLLDPTFDGQRTVFTIDGQTIGLLSREFYFTRTIDGSERSLFQLAADSPSTSVADAYPAVTKEMETACWAFYETARYLSHFNAPEKLRAPALPSSQG